LQPPDEMSIQKKKRYKLHKTLRKDFKDMPKKSKIDLDEWAVVNVSPSVVANPYLPSLRVFSYNVTSYNAGTEEAYDDDTDVDEQKKGSKRNHGHRHGGKAKNCKKKKNRDRWECRSPQKTWHSDKHAPSRTNRLWSPLGYSQVKCIFLLTCPW
jgi:endopolyphosphatase